MVTPVDEIDGCQHSASCLACPLPQCKYDSLLNVRRTKERVALDRRILTLRKAGWQVREIAEELAVTTRTVYRGLVRTEETEK